MELPRDPQERAWGWTLVLLMHARTQPEQVQMGGCMMDRSKRCSPCNGAVLPAQCSSPIVKDVFLTELVIRDVRNWFFFHPLLQLIESLRLVISLYCRDSDL